jgi:2-polyprenyl-3-methyl-5-hydroxy-6-metoxy-1,4-benzoquinol methylase
MQRLAKAPMEGRVDPSMRRSCSLCGDDRVRHIFDKADIPYFKCLACGFVFSRPATNANFENTIGDYEPAYLQYLEESVEDERTHVALLNWAEGFLPLEGKRVLDVGAGSGKFVRFLRRRRVEAHGIEPAAPLYSRFLADEPFFFSKSIEAFAEESEGDSFDVVFASDVMEHVERPDVFLCKVSRLLEPGGMLFVSTPDVESLLARVSRRHWHYFNKYHLSYLSRRTLGAAASQHGFREVGFSRLPRWKSTGYLLQYLADFVMGGNRIRLPGPWYEFVLPINLHDTMYLAFENERETCQH